MIAIKIKMPCVGINFVLLMNYPVRYQMCEEKITEYIKVYLFLLLVHSVKPSFFSLVVNFSLLLETLSCSGWYICFIFYSILKKSNFTQSSTWKYPYQVFAIHRNTLWIKKNVIKNEGLASISPTKFPHIEWFFPSGIDVLHFHIKWILHVLMYLLVT